MLLLYNTRGMYRIEPIHIANRLAIRSSHAMLGHQSGRAWPCAVFGEYCALAHMRGVPVVLVENITTVHGCIRRSVY
jgi:hypothetical protein